MKTYQYDNTISIYENINNIKTIVEDIKRNPSYRWDFGSCTDMLIKNNIEEQIMIEMSDIYSSAAMRDKIDEFVESLKITDVKFDIKFIVQGIPTADGILKQRNNVVLKYSDFVSELDINTSLKNSMYSLKTLHYSKQKNFIQLVKDRNVKILIPDNFEPTEMNAKELNSIKHSISEYLKLDVEFMFESQFKPESKSKYDI